VPNFVAVGQTVAEIRRFFDFSKLAAKICDVCVQTTHEVHSVVVINLQNLVRIDDVVLIMRKF